MTELEIFVRLILSLGLGALIGSERERFAKQGDEFVFGGIRTFTFISLLGALSSFIAQEYLDWFVVPVFLSVVLLICISYHISNGFSKGKSIGVTGEIAAFLSFLVGMLCFTSHIILAIALAIVIATFLYLKRKLHKFLNQVSEEEMYSTFIFAVIAFVILPFLPNQAYDPLGVLNPYKIWLMVVFICGLGYVGYILTKILGSKNGIGITGLVGGMVSSTAVTMTFAGRSKKEKDVRTVRLFVFAALLANAIMFIRVLIEVFVVNRRLLSTLMTPILVMAGTAFICAGYLWFKRDKASSGKSQPVKYTSPLSLGPAVKFGVLFMVVLVVIKVAQLYFGHVGIYIASILSGLVDADAIVLSMAGIAGKEISDKVAATAITLAVMSNTLVKAGYASLFGSKDFGKRIMISVVIIVITGLLAIWLL